jgi:hypothetical protein
MPDGTVVVGGQFEVSYDKGDVVNASLARYDPASHALTPIPTASPLGVRALLATQSGQLLAAGVVGYSPTFDPLEGVVRVDLTTSETTRLGNCAGSSPSGQILALAERPDGRIVAAGVFSSLCAVPANNVASYDPATNTWSSLGSGIALAGDSPGVRSIKTLPGGDLVFGGRIFSAGGLPTESIAIHGRSVAVIDGTRECLYGPPLHVQTTNTHFGDAVNGNVFIAGASEINSFSARVQQDTLYLHIAGNLETDPNRNKMEIFIDAIPGGQNRLRGDQSNLDLFGLNMMGDVGAGDGLTFDAGFEPDRYLTLTGDASGTSVRVNWAELPTNGPGPATYLGATPAAPPARGLLAGGTNTWGIRAAINNANTAGVLAGTGPADQAAAAAVSTGVEVAIPLAALGLTNSCTASIKICAFINGVWHDFVSNQVVGSVPPGTANLGDPRAVNFAAIPGEQCVAVPIAGTTPTISSQPSGTSLPCASGRTAMLVQAHNATTFQWQWRAAPADAWQNAQDGATPVAHLQVLGVQTAWLSIERSFFGGTPPPSVAREIQFRCVVANACGSSVQSAPAQLTLDACACGPGDIAGPGTSIGPDGELTADDVIVFINWFSANSPRADIAGPGLSEEPDLELTADDIVVFVNRFTAGC